MKKKITYKRQRYCQRIYICILELSHALCRCEKVNMDVRRLIINMDLKRKKVDGKDYGHVTK